MAIFAILAVILAVHFRIAMLKYYGFYEPDGFYHFAVVRAAVNDGFHVPPYLSISGWPHSAPTGEAHGIYWVTLLPYAILQYFGVSFYTIMRLIPVAYAILDMLFAYILSRYVSKDKLFGALVILFIALSMGNAARTSALIYRGDSFAPLFLLIALILMIEVFRQEGRNRKLAVALAAGVAISLCNLVWNGGPFGFVVFVLTTAFIMSYAFIFRKEKMMDDSKYLLVSLLSWFAVVSVAHAVGTISVQQLMSLSYFLPLLFSLAVLWFFVNFATSRMPDLTRTTIYRLGLILFVIIAGLVLFAAVEPTLIYNVFVGNGFVTTTGSFGSTIEELQPPNFQFLFTSFGINMFTSLPTLFMSLSLYFNLQGIWLSFYGVIGVIALILLFIPYMFMHVYDSGPGFLSGKPALKFDVAVPMLAIMAFFIVTGYLQMHIIRFNALFSIPLAIMSAYTIYWLILAAKHVTDKKPRHLLILLSSIAFGLGGLMFGYVFGIIISIVFALVLVSLSYIIISRGRNRAAVFLAFAVILIFISTEMVTGFSGSSGMLLLITWLLTAIFCVMAVISAILCYVYMMREFSGDYSMVVILLSATVLLYLLFSLLYYGTLYSSSLVQADSINPQFIAAMQWLKSNSPSNSVVLTLWPDGSVVEAVSNRTSVTDSVGSQNTTKADPFAAWLLNSSPDPQFLTNPILTGSPNYLVVRNTWLIETQGIYTEAHITKNVSLYGYAPLTSFSESAANSTTRQLVLRVNSTVAYPYAVVNIAYSNTTNTANQILAYLQTSPTQVIPFAYVGFMDQNNGNYSQINQQTRYNSTNGDLLLIQYSSIPRSGGFFINLTGAFIFGPGIADSNMLKFLFMCNAVSCPWDNSKASLNLIFANPDTKIFKITYNTTG
ncbi:MAG: hypothetical protein ACYCO0_02385 [Candidatus Micrarchaeaceae archaeon]